MTLREFLDNNPNVVPDGPFNQVFGPSGVLRNFESRRAKETRIILYYYHDDGTHCSLKTVVVDSDGNILKKNRYE